MDIQTISVKKLRENFPWVKEELEAGRQLMLVYRSKPLAELKPVGRQRRSFSKKQLEEWIRQDTLTQKEQKQVEEIINRLP